MKPCYMLEHPKTQEATEAKILVDEACAEMDNQQVTQYEVGWAAGFIDGEGYIGVSMYSNHKGSAKSVKVELNIVNTDEAMIQKYICIMKKIGVVPYVTHRVGKDGKKDIFKADLHRMSPILKVLNVILPHLTGAKKERATLIKDFLASRLSKSEQIPGVSILYTDKELEIIDKCLSLQKRGTSETTRKAELAAYQRKGKETIEKRCRAAQTILKLHKEGINNRQIAIALGYHENSGPKVGWWIRQLKSNKSPIQKLGYFPPYSDDIVRP